MDEKSTTRRSVFAVWRWPRLVWAGVTVLMPVAYFLSEPPVLFLLLSTTGRGWLFSPVATTVYFPALWCAEHCETLGAIWDWEYNVLHSLWK